MIARINMPLLRSLTGAEPLRGPERPAQDPAQRPITKKRWYKGPAHTSEEVLAETRESHPDCKCEDAKFMGSLGLPILEAGIHVDDLSELESGCTTGRWVCSRLDAVRRRHGR